MKKLTITLHEDNSWTVSNDGLNDVQILGYLEILKQQILYDRLKIDNMPSIKEEPQSQFNSQFKETEK